MKAASIILFIFLALSADLKVTLFPYVHWILWSILILPFMLRDFLKEKLIISPMFGVAFILVMLGMLSSFLRGAEIENLIQIIKLVLILITLYYFIYYSKIGWNEINIALNTAVIVNVMLLIFGLLGVSSMASLMTSDGRWGTALAFPGSLVKIGTFGFYFNIMAFLLLPKKQKVIHFFMLSLSLFVIYMDGSRTGMLLIFLTLLFVFLFYIIVNHKNKIKSVVLPFFAFIIFFAGLIIAIPFLLQSRIGKSLINLLNSGSFSTGLELVDPARFMMYKSAIEKIYNNPFIGTGAFTTVGIYEDGTSMVVHNTYLQLWGDFGLFGLLGMCLIFFGWIAFLPKIMLKLQINKNKKENIVVSSSILMLIYYIGNGLFHPYSTELSEWITFILPLTYCYSYYRGYFQRRGEK
ncbi:O-antigen ligase family protein [Lysinibacillus xylanilyticus]|uniref:O-antigen ligase family protein n=1 Tax=Lysinibacillus xylanilyticus TaxID=582475 RepID=UPI003D06BD95